MSTQQKILKTHALRLAALPAALALITLSSPAHAQSQDDRFILRLSAFGPEASLGFSGSGVVTDGSNQASFEFSESVATSRQWRPRGALGFRISERQALVALGSISLISNG